MGHSLTGLSWINNSETSKRCDLSESSIPDGWVAGMLPDHVEKLAESKKGSNHWNYGRHVSDNTRKKISRTLQGHKESFETKLKKKESSKNRPVMLCNGCQQFYMNCHSRHHIKCSLIDE